MNERREILVAKLPRKLFRPIKYKGESWRIVGYAADGGMYRLTIEHETKPAIVARIGKPQIAKPKGIRRIMFKTWKKLRFWRK